MTAAIERIGQVARSPRLAMMALLTLFGLGAAVGGVRYVVNSRSAVIDFDAFWLAGKMVWAGRAGDTYSFSLFKIEQRTISTAEKFMTWTYPPPYDLVVAPLALMPPLVAYLAFVLVTLVAFLVVLQKLSKREPVTVLAVLAGAMLTTIVCGQNGFLIAALVGLTAIGLLGGHRWAGIPLGLLIIKPHLVLGLVLYVLLDRRWSVVAVAAATVGATALLTTVLLGPAIWTAFVTGVAETGRILAGGTYPFFRMISAFASLRTMRLSVEICFAVHIAVALIALAGVVLARFRLAPRDAIGVAIIAGLLFSPYAYDYDLPILAIGLALVLPALIRLGRGWERWLMYACIAVAGGTGFVQSMRPPTPYKNIVGAAPDFITLAGPLLIVAMLVMWRIFARGDGLVRGQAADDRRR